MRLNYWYHRSAQSFNHWSGHGDQSHGRSLRPKDYFSPDEGLARLESILCTISLGEWLGLPAKAGWQVSCSPCHSGVGWVLPGQLTFLAVVDRRAYVSSLYFTIFDPTLPRLFDKRTVSQRYIIQRTKTSSCKFVYNTLVL